LIKKIFLVHHTHTDIGYTDIQENVFRSHLKFLDDALNYCEKTKIYPENSRFRWTCEVLWQVEHYFQIRAEKIKDFRKWWTKGQIEVTGLYLNLTDLYSLEMLIRSFYFLKKLRARYRIKVICATNCDVNGLSWNIPGLLNKLGISYLLMATSEIRGFAPEVERPFWWQGPCGSKLLVWNAGRKLWYAEGLHLGFGESYKKLKELLPEHLKEIEQDYPYDAICLQIAMDNQPPLLKICDTVRTWNEKEKNPEIVIATPSMFFEYMKDRYEQRFPVYKLSWPDWWADGNGSCALETLLCLNNRRRIIENECLWSLLNLKGKRYPAERIRDIWRNLFFFAEHTFGASESVSRPFSASTLKQWAIKSGFVYQADIENQRLINDGEKFFAVVCQGEKEDRRKQKIETDTMENDFYRIKFNLKTGRIESIYDRQLKEELVDSTAFYSFNQYIYENINRPAEREAIWKEHSEEPLWAAGRKRKEAQFIRYKPVFKSLEIYREEKRERCILRFEGKGCSQIISEINLPHLSKKIEITNTISKNAVIEPEGLYFAFPFNFRRPSVRICGPGKAVFEPETQQLSGSCRDYYSIEDWVVICDEKKEVCFVSPDAPLIQIADINTGKWLKKLLVENGTIFSYVMNNYWYTNFRAYQEGRISFRYFITSARKITNSSAENFSTCLLMPFLYRLRKDYIKIDRKNLSLISFKKSEDKKGFVLRIKECEGKKTSFHLKFPQFKKVEVFLSNLTEEKLNQIKGCCSIDAWQVLTLYLLIDR